uniref:Protein-serine O-palmitoleoyltransferase porcupine n=1 Tax=Parastrongyloides trichosuri TaxID=131310 RepID=A0A0N4Z9T3_PARTI
MGLMGIYILSSRNVLIPTITIHVVYFITSFFILKIFKKFPYIPVVCSIVSILSIQFYLNEEAYSSVHGSLMIMSMKMISLAFEKKYSFFDVYGYIFSPGTLIYGPFVTLAQHNESYGINFFSKIHIPILAFILSTSFLILSHYVPNELEFLNWYNILIQYKTAASFRYSHYFISYISLSLASLSGIKIDQVSLWLKVEIPRSMMNVACYWNIPMHIFFHTCNKKYFIDIYKNLKQYNNFMAVILTFVFSSMLHGFNFQLTAVLISIGINASVESKLRNKLSKKFDCCCKSRECLENCEHSNKYFSLRTIIINTVFLLLNIYHLIYLGAPFDDSYEGGRYTINHTLNVWSQQFYFISPILTLIVILITYIF